MSHETCNLTADEALERLREGNARYLGASQAQGDVSPELRQSTFCEGQHPYAIVLACSDSRVIPEAIFSAGIGDLFVIRVAGNVVDKHQLGSIEYAEDHLGCSLVVVLGHTGCGAVDAAMQQAVAEQMSEAKPVSAQDEIEAANTVFERYGFAFYDLAASSPKSDKTRRSCAAAVGTLLHSPVLFASMQSAHSLPIKALAQQCGVSARTITRHRDYIVAAALLIDGDYPILCTYLQTMRKEAEQCVR